MPLQFNKFMEPLRVFAVAISIVWPIVTVSARPIDKTLIESAILINHEELTNPGSLYASSRFRRSIIPDVDVNSTLAGLGTPWQNVPSGLAGTMKNLFVGSGKNTNDEIKEGVRLALEYIRDKRDNLGLDIDQIGKATQAIVQGALEASADRNTLTPDSLEWNAFGSGLEGVTPDEQALYENYLQRLDPADANNWTQSFESSSPAEKDTSVRAFLQIAPEGLAQLLPSVVIETFIPIASRAWKVSAPDLVKSLSEGMARGTIIANLPNPAGSVSAQPDREKLMGFVSEGTITATMGRMKTATLLGGADFGFHPGIDPIDANTTTSDATMMLGGNPQEPRFHPDKTRILEYAANGLTYGALAAAKDSGNILSVNVPTLAEQIGAGAAKAAVAFMADIPLGQVQTLITTFLHTKWLSP